jgi:hypothetical protein
MAKVHEQISEAIEGQLGPIGAGGVELASTMTGVAQRTAEVVVAEIGTDMSVFPTAGHLAGCAGRCPGNDQSAGQTPLRAQPQGLQVARHRARRGRARRDPQQRQLPRRPIPTPQAAHRARPGTRRRQALDADRLLARVQHRRDLPPPRRRLLPTPRPRTPHQAPRRQAPSARRPRHAPTSHHLIPTACPIRRRPTAAYSVRNAATALWVFRGRSICGTCPQSSSR